MSSNRPTSQFGLFPKYEQSNIANLALGLEILSNPDGIRFSNGDNVWRIRIEVDNNLVFAYSTDKGETYTVRYVFAPT